MSHARPKRSAARPGRRVRTLVRAGVVVMACSLVAAGVASPAAWSSTTTGSTPTVMPAPKAPVVLPAAAEGLQPYVPQRSCDPYIKPGVRKFRALMLATYKTGSDGGSTRACSVGGTSEHYEGRAWDWMLPVTDTKDKKVADSVIAWLLKKGPDGTPALEARRLGVMYIMYNHRIWGTWDAAWKPISKGNDQHTSHVHFSFSWAGAEGHTSFWTGRVGAFDYGPCPVYAGQPAVIRTRANPRPCSTSLPAAPRSTHAILWFGAGGAALAKAESLLAVPVASRTTTFGTTVRKAVVAYQKAHHLPVTGVVDKATWVVLDPASKLPPKPVTTTSSGNASAGGSATSGTSSSTTWVTLRQGMTGPRVVALQTALKLAVANRTGTFGPITLAAVKAFQKSHGLAVDGVVGPLTARALGLLH